jgi:cbb3-type cytochrome oxidase maturation protein
MWWLIIIALSMGLGGLAAFLWSLRTGQYDDLDGAAERVLLEEDPDDGGPDRKGEAILPRCTTFRAPDAATEKRRQDPLQ